ncbi:MAG: hypothetical protein RLZZ602_1326 [Pseudomonadota bacterium]
MILINFFGKMWFGEVEWNKRKTGQALIDRQWVEPYFSHPLEREAWLMQRSKFRKNDGYLKQHKET